MSVCKRDQRNKCLIINKIYIFFYLLFVGFSVFSQSKELNKNRDAIAVLLQEYKKTKEPHLPSKAFLLAEKIKIDSVLKSTYVEFGMKSFFNKDLANLILVEKKLQNFYTQTKDSSALAKQYYYKSLFFKVLNSGDNLAKADSSFYYLNKSKNISVQLKDSLEATRRLLSMAALQYREGDFIGSESSIIEGLRLVEPLEEVFFTGLLYERLGNVMYRLERYKEARKDYLKFFELQKKIPNIQLKYEKVRLDVHLAKTYEADGNYIKSIEYFNKCLLVTNLKVDNAYRYEAALEGFSFGNFMLGNTEIAIKGYLEVLTSRQTRGYKRGLIFSYALLGEFYAAKNEKKKAIFFIKKSLQIAKELHTTKKKSQNLLLLSRLVGGEKGRNYLEEHTLLNDSLYKRERILKNQFAKVRYETEKKDIENASLKEENLRKQLELERQKQQKMIGWLLVGGCVLFIGFGASILTSRKKKLVFEAKMKQIEVREKERQQIAKSLHDEVAGDLITLHLKLTKQQQTEAVESLEIIKDNVRNLSHKLRSESFEKVSFKDQIINLISDYFEVNFKVKVQEIDRINWLKINDSIKRILFLAIREAIQNSKKHGEATVISLNFSESKKAIFLTVSDNGKGFTTASKKAGIGLKNMRERVEEINGFFSIESEVQKGTNINIEISKSGA
jgi:signal transduction histidine kinase